MKEITLSHIIGKTISSVRYSYIVDEEDELQEFYSFLKLSDGNIIGFPFYDYESYIKLSEENIKYFNDSFNSGKELLKFGKDRIEGQSIDDIYFIYLNNEIDELKKPYYKLSNGYYITEINYGPPGMQVDLIILDEDEYNSRVTRLDEDVRSYLKKNKRK